MWSEQNQFNIGLLQIQTFAADLWIFTSLVRGERRADWDTPKYDRLTFKNVWSYWKFFLSLHLDFFVPIVK